MKPLTKSKLKYIIGLIIAVLTALVTYITPSCSVFRDNHLLVDSLSVKHAEIHNTIDAKSSIK